MTFASDSSIILCASWVRLTYCSLNRWFSLRKLAISSEVYAGLAWIECRLFSISYIFIAWTSKSLLRRCSIVSSRMLTLRFSSSTADLLAASSFIMWVSYSSFTASSFLIASSRINASNYTWELPYPWLLSEFLLLSCFSFLICSTVVCRYLFSVTAFASLIFTSESSFLSSKHSSSRVLCLRLFWFVVLSLMRLCSYCSVSSFRII